MGEERVRIVDIAEELGVSTATVSNVIHGKTRKISDETVKRVQQLLEEKNYIPNMAGILLAQNSSKLIGVVIHDHKKYEGRTLEDGFIAASLNALSKEIDQAGCFMMVKLTTDWNAIIRIASMWNMEGLVLIGFCEQDYQKLREQMHIPFVVYDGYFPETEKICNVTIDHYDGGYQAGAYLREMGHEKVLCISDNVICMDKERMDGCAAAFGAHRTERMVVPMEKEQRLCLYRKQFARWGQYTAVFAVSDVYAIELMQFLQSQGVRVPEDVSVIGFDDNRTSAESIPPLTTIRQDDFLRAKTAIEMLQKLKEGTCAQTKVVLPVSLVVRESVKSCKQQGEKE